jgi:hypothetical protein
LGGTILVLPFLHGVEGFFDMLLQLVRVEQVVLSVINLEIVVIVLLLPGGATLTGQ